MSQVAIVIDCPDHSVEDLQGNTLLRIAEDTVRAIRKQLPVDDRVQLHAVLQATDLGLGELRGYHVVSDEPEPEAEIEEYEIEEVVSAPEPITEPDEAE